MRLCLMGLLLVLCACAPSLSSDAVVEPAPDVVVKLNEPVNSQVRVVVMGDQGRGNATQAAVARAMQAVCAQKGCDLGVGLGDNFYPAGPKDPDSPWFKERFADLYGPLGVPFLMIPGNHDESWLIGGDGMDATGADVQMAYGKVNPQWVMPARTYRAVAGDLLEIFALDTTPLATYLPVLRPDERPGGRWDRAQRAWLTGALARSSARWKLVLGHYPLFNNGSHGEAGSYDGLPLAFQRGDAVRDTYALACGKADLMLAGHTHTLAIFPPQPTCTGTWTLISGAGAGGSGRGPGQRPAAFEVHRQAGFMWLDIRPDALVVQVYTTDENSQLTLLHTQEIRK